MKIIWAIKTFIGAGHGKRTLGKRSADGTYREYQGNRDLAEDVTALIENSENIIGTSPINISLKQRVEYVNAYKGESILLSLHSNASTNSGWGKARGHVIFYFKWSKKSKLLATCISQRLEEYSELPSRGIKGSLWLFMLRKSKMAAALCEIGFHDNKEDLVLMKRDRKNHAMAISMGVADYKGLVKTL